MEEDILTGVINVEVALVKTEPEILKKLFARFQSERESGKENPYIDEKSIKILMRYNVWTVDQFCDVSGRNVSTITNLTRPSLEKGSDIVIKLDTCYPFPDSGGKGPKFVVRNQKSEKYIKV